LFEPDTYKDLYTVWSEPRTTKAWKAFKAECAVSGLTILRPQQEEYAYAIAAAVRAHPLAMWYLEGALYEQTLVWQDEQTGMVCKGRTDAMNVRRHALTDLKVLIDINEQAVQRKVYGFGWVEALAHYSAGAIATDIWTTPPRRVIIAAESKPPFDVGVFVLDGESCVFGDETNREMLDKVKGWRDSGVYPGRYPTEQSIEPPRWALPDEEEGATEGLIFNTEEEESE
jgi:exodeoxyribonuclease VIII